MVFRVGLSLDSIPPRLAVPLISTPMSFATLPEPSTLVPIVFFRTRLPNELPRKPIPATLLPEMRLPLIIVPLESWTRIPIPLASASIPLILVPM